MIIEFSVKNFRSIKDEQTISFEATSSKELEEYLVFEPDLLYPKKTPLRLLKLSLIYGANGSGKSNFLASLDALDMAMRMKKKDKDDEFDFIVPFLFNKKTINEPTEMRISFIANDKIIYDYEIKIDKKCVIEEKLSSTESGKGVLFHRTTDVDKKISFIDIKPRMKMKSDDKTTLSNSTLWNETVLGAFNALNIENEYLDSVIDWVSNILMPQVEPKTDLLSFISKGVRDGHINKESLIETMRDADFCVSDFFEKDHQLTNEEEIFIEKIKSNKGASAIKLAEQLLNKKDLFFTHTVDDDNYNLKYDDESLGTQRYFQLSGLINHVTSKNKILGIDEFESSLHPSLVNHFLVKFMKTKHKSQMIITTHYREFLFNKENFRKDCIWIANKIQKTSETEIYSIADFDTKTIRETSSVYNAYKSGKLGGTPNI